MLHAVRDMVGLATAEHASLSYCRSCRCVCKLTSRPSFFFVFFFFFFFKQKTAYEMNLRDWSSDVCSSDLNLWVRKERSVLLPDGEVVNSVTISSGPSAFVIIGD